MIDITKLPKDYRLAALIRFSVAITLFTIIGHVYLGFEQSWAYPFVGAGVAYCVELLLDTVSAYEFGHTPVIKKSPIEIVKFLLPAHITGLAVSMLLYARANLWPIAFAAVVAVSSKYILRIYSGGRFRHFFNPSNTGITTTLLLFPWVGIAPTYQFTENTTGLADWAVPLFIVCTGSVLNAKFTRRAPLVLAFVTAFILQAICRWYFLNHSLLGCLYPMTGVTFVLFTFYMVSDPGTTPVDTKMQIAFGGSVAVIYGLLVSQHIVFGIMFSLTIVCASRFLYHSLIVSKRSVVLSSPALASSNR